MTFHGWKYDGYTRHMMRVADLRLSTPERIQDFLDSLSFNYEREGETCRSPRMVLAHKSAHCLEGALLAATLLANIGERPRIMNLQTGAGDDDHAVALFKRNGLWGAISKTNHAVLRYRDPIYPTLAELARSYFHEYFLGETGRKTLRAYSRPLSLKRFGTSWIESEKDVWHIAYALADAVHIPIAPKSTLSKLRNASLFERTVIEKTEWDRHGKKNKA